MLIITPNDFVSRVIEVASAILHDHPCMHCPLRLVSFHAQARICLLQEFGIVGIFREIR
jgi:hypothetical protein